MVLLLADFEVSIPSWALAVVPGLLVQDSSVRLSSARKIKDCFIGKWCLLIAGQDKIFSSKQNTLEKDYPQHYKISIFSKKKEALMRPLHIVFQKQVFQ
jgi:hypothetical protein